MTVGDGDRLIDERIAEEIANHHTTTCQSRLFIH